MKKALLLCTMLLNSALSFAFDGSGTQNDPYQIKTAEDEYVNDPNKSTVTGGVSDIAAKKATITSWANIDASESSTIKIGIIYDTNDVIDKGNGKQVTISNSSLGQDGKYSVSITTLTPNTKYYYRSFINLGGIWLYGDILSFTTINEGISLITGDAINITCYSAKINANIAIESNIIQSSCYYGVCYSQSDLPTIDDIRERSTTKDDEGMYTVTFKGLSCNTKYYYRAYATYDGGTYYGEVRSIQTTADDILSTGEAVMEGNKLSVRSKLSLNGGSLNSIVVGLCFSKNNENPTVRNTQYTTTELDNDFSYTTTFKPCNGKIYYRAFATIDDVTHYGDTRSIDFFVEDTKKYVDLGLPSGTLWATNNVGAQRPEEFGDYFAWGETDGYYSGKRIFEIENYKFYDVVAKGYTKYCNNLSKWVGEGDVDRKWTLDAEDDAATFNWGEDWRMPTLKECQELLSCCYWKFCRYNNVKGYLVFKRLERDTTPINIDNSFTSTCAQAYDLSCPHIFFPQAGRIEGDKYTKGANEYEVSSFWTSSMYEYNSAYFLSLSNCVETWYGFSKHYYGFSIRPVRAATLTSCDKPTINFTDGKIVCTSCTPGAKCYYTLNTSITEDSNGNQSVNLIIKAYANAEGYTKSPEVTRTISINLEDINIDEELTVDDVTRLIDKILKKNK